ncbi:hypothetical protein KY289_032554 [Solanum tuberosum]|nr:hypothetical protein KY289_032554 [Solanum tuberosum]
MFLSQQLGYRYIKNCNSNFSGMMYTIVYYLCSNPCDKVYDVVCPIPNPYAWVHRGTYEANFLALCSSDYYDGTIFHRNIKGFMIQGGDPTGTGKGGTSIWGKKFNDEIRESLKHNARGMLAMANSGPNTNGSQFFITYAKQPHLNGLYTIFGKVIHGLEVLDLMEKTPTGPGDKPLAEIRLNRVTIHANPLAG